MTINSLFALSSLLSWKSLLKTETLFQTKGTLVDVIPTGEGSAKNAMVASHITS
jgi:hypothetical protein